MWLTVDGVIPTSENAAMHESLFAFPSTLARYRLAPLLAERERFLQHCAQQAHPRSALEKIAWFLRIAAESPVASPRICPRARPDRMTLPYCSVPRPTLIHP